jgi:hypothetical protein
MCEFRRTPIGRFPDRHHGSDAPNCTIDVRIRCLEDFCDDPIEVVIVDRDSGESLTEPTMLECDGSDREYSLPMAVSCGLEARRTVMRFRCCDQERDGEADRIWIRCE